MRYAIEVIGYGKRQRYTIKAVTESGLIVPVDCKVYKTEQAARTAAKELGAEIAVVGDFYKVASLSR